MFNLIFKTRDINITNLSPVKKFGSSSKSTQFSKTISISTIIIKDSVMKISIPLLRLKENKRKK